MDLSMHSTKSTVNRQGCKDSLQLFIVSAATMFLQRQPL